MNQIDTLSKKHETPSPNLEIIGGEAIDYSPVWLNALTKAFNRPNIDQTQRLNNVRAIAQSAIDRKILSETQINNHLRSLGLPVNIETQPAEKQPDAAKSFEPNYKAIADRLPIDPKNLRGPDSFIQPVVTNMFADQDKATLAGRMISSVYSALINRDTVPPYKPGETQQLLDRSKQTRRSYVENIKKLNQERQANNQKLIPLEVSRATGQYGFHFDGNMLASKDFQFFFNKSSANYKQKGAGEIRAYITLKPELAEQNQEYFVELASILYDAGVDFTAKAGSVFNVRERTDNMVFYISIPDQQRASQLIKDFLQQKAIGMGHMTAAIPSPQEGLSWAIEPDEKQNALWRKITGSSKPTSFNSFVAAKSMPYYLDRLASAHHQQGNNQSALTFENEANRIRALI